MDTLNMEQQIRKLANEEAQRVVAEFFAKLTSNLPVITPNGNDQTAPKTKKKPAPLAPPVHADLTKLTEGSAVKFRQGRGEFTAKVKKVDLTNGKLILTRDEDGKEIERPADKVYV